MRKNTSVKEKEKDHRWVLFSGDPKTIAMRTLPLMRMCINSGLNIEKKNHEMQHGNCTKVFTSSTGRTKKIRERSSNQKLLQELSPGHESVMRKRFWIFSQAYLCIWWARATLFMKNIISEIERVLYDYCSELINHYDRRGYRDLDMFITVQVLEDSLAALFVGAVCDERGYPYEREDQQSPTSTNSGKKHQLQVGNLCSYSRTGSCCRHKSPKRCRCNIRRPRARSSRLVSTVDGWICTDRFWIIRQCWWNNPQHTAST